MWCNQVGSTLLGSKSSNWTIRPQDACGESRKLRCNQYEVVWRVLQGKRFPSLTLLSTTPNWYSTRRIQPLAHENSSKGGGAACAKNIIQLWRRRGAFSCIWGAPDWSWLGVGNFSKAIPWLRPWYPKWKVSSCCYEFVDLRARNNETNQIGSPL